MGKISMTCNFFFQAALTLKHRTKLKDFFNSIARKEGKQIESVNFIFCTDEQLLAINKDFLKHDFFTDIITFELQEGKNNPKQAEIYISVDRVRENARAFNTTLTHEIHRVMFHGVLHLCGYADKKAKDQKLMRSKENEYISLYFKG